MNLPHPQDIQNYYEDREDHKPLLSEILTPQQWELYKVWEANHYKISSLLNHYIEGDPSLLDTFRDKVIHPYAEVFPPSLPQPPLNSNDSLYEWLRQMEAVDPDDLVLEWERD